MLTLLSLLVTSAYAGFLEKAIGDIPCGSPPMGLTEIGSGVYEGEPRRFHGEFEKTYVLATPEQGVVGLISLIDGPGVVPKQTLKVWNRINEDLGEPDESLNLVGTNDHRFVWHLGEFQLEVYNDVSGFYLGLYCPNAFPKLEL